MSFQAMAQAVKIKTNTSTEKLVILMLANYADEDNQAYPSYKRLASDCCMTDRAVKVIMGRLRKLGYITWVRRKKSNGSKEYTSNLYTMHLDNPVAPVNTDSENPAPPQQGKTEEVVNEVHQGSDLKSLQVVNENHQGSEPGSLKPISEPISKNLSVNQTTTTTQSVGKISLEKFVETVEKKMTGSDVQVWFIRSQAAELWEQYQTPRVTHAMKIIFDDWRSIDGVNNG